MKGTWKGSGTWKSDGPDPAVVVAVLIAVLLVGGSGAAVAHVVTSLLVIAAIVVGVLVAASVAALFLLWRATRHREAAYEASDRHQQIMATVAEITGKPQVTQGTQPPAIENHYHVHHHYGTDDRPQLRVIRGEVER